MKEKAFNAFLTLVASAALLYVGNSVMENNKQMARFSAEMARNVSDHEKFDLKLDGMVARKDYDVEIANVRTRLTTLELEVVKLRSKVGL